MSETNLQVLLKARPVGLPRLTDFEILEAPVPEPAPGQAVVRQRYLSLDPAMRGWMDARDSYIAPVELGAVMRGFGVGEVVASASDDLAEGDTVVGLLGWQRFAVVDADRLDKAPEGMPMPLLLGPLGIAGITAHVGLLDIGKPQEGETVLVSGGAGAVGSIVGQIAKIKGCRVVGIAGSDEKCSWISDELGFDAAINYRTAGSIGAAIGRACPEGVDIYFDNVGGETLDAALARINLGARVVICGAISIYNATEPPPGPRNYLRLLVKRARMEGFIVMDYKDRYPQIIEELAGWLMSGRLQHRDHVVRGLENAPASLGMLFDGSNQGKLMIEVT